MPLIRKEIDSAATPARALGDSLRHGTAEERWAAARGLGDDPTAVAALASALLRETDPRVREAILTSLARSAAPEAVGAVLPHLRSDDASLRTGALDALRAMTTAVRPRLVNLLQDPDADVRLLACELVRHVPGADASSLLARVLEMDPEVNVCAAAVETLAEVGGSDDVAPLLACADRFRDSPFLRFSIDVTLERIAAKPPPARV